MIRQNISIGTFTYIVDLYEAFTDIVNEDMHYAEYVMLRLFDITNDVAIDKDLFFVERSLVNDCSDANGKIDINKLATLIAYPIPHTDMVKHTLFSTSYKEYSFGYSEQSFKIGKDLYEINDADGISASIPCDLMRIYHPSNKKHLDAIIHVDNWINDIHIHYFCRPYSCLSNGVMAEFSIDNVAYCEYSELWLPHLDSLFSDSLYINDVFNIYLDSNDEEMTAVSMRDFISCFSIQQKETKEGESIDEVITCKRIDHMADDEVVNFTTAPFTLTIYPYSGISQDGLYVYDEALPANSDVFATDRHFMLTAKMGFSEENGIISVISKFDYPGCDRYSLQQAYAIYVPDAHTEGVTDDYAEGDEFYVNAEHMAVKIIMSTSNDFRNPIYSVEHSIGNIDDFSFELNDIFSVWSQYPEMLLIRTVFIDKDKNVYIRSNDVYVTKEWFKYFINDIYIHKININMETGKSLYLIDKINCSIIKNDTGDKVNGNRNVLGTRVLYKPIFFRTQDLQNIRIRAGITQNIGINLGDYMTKVENFRLSISGITCSEIGRNDIYVIFSVDGALLNNASGKYDIFGDDDMYISTGTYSIF